MGISVRPVTAADVPAVGQVIAVAFNDVCQRHGFPSPWPRPETAELMTGFYVSYPEARGFVAECDGRLVGSGFAHIRGDKAGIGPVTVAPGAQGSGAGRAIMERLLEETRECSSVRLIQDAFNNVSFSLYSKLGFVPREVVARFVADHPRPAPSANSLAVRDMTTTDLESVAALDEQKTGMRRHPDFALLLSLGAQLVCERDGRLTGFLCRVPADDECMLGPGTAETLDDLWALLCEAVRVPGPARVRFWVTARQHELLRYAFDAGFLISSLSTYMVKGEWQPPEGPHFMAMFPEAI
jgi:GNAT superfamily N-acetyltransferase